MSTSATAIFGAISAYWIINQVKITPTGDLFIKDMWVLGFACNLALLTATSGLWM